MSIPKQSVRHIRLDRLIAHGSNRDLSNDSALTELADSIREYGLLQPVIVTEHPTEPDRWLILGGHRRVAASSLAGLDAVPCVIRHNLDDHPDEQAIVMLVENCQRKDLTAVEKAEAFGALRRQGMSLAQISRRTGLAEGTISPYLSLLELDKPSLDRVRTGEVKVTEAIRAVRAVRKQARTERGERQAGRPVVREPAHFGKWHPLANLAASRCNHTTRPMIGGLACGQCWEAEIRADSSVTA